MHLRVEKLEHQLVLLIDLVRHLITSGGVPNSGAQGEKADDEEVVPAEGIDHTPETADRSDNSQGLPAGPVEGPPAHRAAPEPSSGVSVQLARRHAASRRLQVMEGHVKLIGTQMDRDRDLRRPGWQADAAEEPHVRHGGNLSWVRKSISSWRQDVLAFKRKDELDNWSIPVAQRGCIRKLATD